MSSLLSDPVFWVSIATLVIGAYRFSLSQAYKSKCTTFKMCCGFIDIQRNVEVERVIDEHTLETEEHKNQTDLVI